MPLSTTRELLDNIRRFHQAVSRHYHRLSRGTDRQRLKLLLDYMAAHEQRLAAALAVYEEQAGQGLLESWFRNAPEIDFNSLISRLQQTPVTEVDDVLRLGLLLDNHLQLSCESLADQAETDELRELFRNILESMQSEKRRLTRLATGASEDI